MEQIDTAAAAEQRNGIRQPHKHNNMKLDSCRIHKNSKDVAQYILMNLKKAILHTLSASYTNPMPGNNMQSVSGDIIRVMTSDHGTFTPGIKYCPYFTMHSVCLHT